MLFLFNLIYASTWGTVAFLIPTEIFPSELRAQGNGFGVSGWAIGVGWTVLVNPIMFGSIKVCTMPAGKSCDARLTFYDRAERISSSQR